MQILQDISLKPFNTFGIDVAAKLFCKYKDADELAEAIANSPNTERCILGGGSNILFTKNFDGIVLKNEVKGVELIKEDHQYVYVKAGAGENWHQFVLYTLQRNWQGLENLSLIPGNVGASPMQNIGAYGIEVKDFFYELEAFHLEEKKIFTFSVNDCGFGYRESVFKNKLKGRFVILNVTFRLNKVPKFNTSYGAIEEELQQMGVTGLTAQKISLAVINIRRSKLPDPATIGNAGSFFKNPSVSFEKFEAMKKSYPAVIGHKNADGTIKLAAGWMIEQCGWKGFRRGDAGCHSQQALVLVNYGKATGKEIYDLSEEILQNVQKKFGVALEREVNII
ncbi:MAG: UDP-N-acetylmuramate dehydrogenase [Bacteroidetes bacterium]|nr:UDP-N-acetylmuramate dehydrogenase [Bacteroidota bacterium]MBS1974654.1 UDP-N-acetylmuramate dehydrogenase [Bacteroidota bacterium]